MKDEFAAFAFAAFPDLAYINVLNNNNNNNSASLDTL